jgi:hypothetical protein
VVVKPLERGLIEHADLFQQHFMAQPTCARLREFRGAARSVRPLRHIRLRPRGVEVELPIEIFHWLATRRRFRLPTHSADRG